MDRETAALALDKGPALVAIRGATGLSASPATVDHGRLRGHNTPHVRLSKPQLQESADATGLRIAVCHFPPGVSKWNGIEHRLFSVRGETGGARGSSDTKSSST